MEDYSSLAAVSMLNLPVRIVACIGMGVEGDVCYAQVFENIAAITAADGFLGTASLLPQSEAFHLYEQAVTYVHEQSGQQPSVINASILSAARGQFGDYHLTDRTRGSRLWISPLMSLYWFFTVEAVAARNLFVDELKKAATAAEACGIIYETRDRMSLRPPDPIQLA